MGLFDNVKISDFLSAASMKGTDYQNLKQTQREEKRRQQEFEQSQKLIPLREEREKALYEARLATEKTRQASLESKIKQGQNKQFELSALYKTLGALNAQKIDTKDPAQLEKLNKLIDMVNFHLKQQLSIGVPNEVEDVTPTPVPEKPGWFSKTWDFVSNNPSIVSPIGMAIKVGRGIAPLLKGGSKSLGDITPEQVPTQSPSVAKPIVSSSGGALGGLTMPIQRSSVMPTSTAQTGGIREISTDEEYDALPSGAEFIDAQTGIKYRKP